MNDALVKEASWSELTAPNNLRHTRGKERVRVASIHLLFLLCSFRPCVRVALEQHH
jgi:hypothetical protein